MPLKDKTKNAEYRKTYHRNWYALNRAKRIQQIRAKNREARDRLYAIAVAIKEQSGCVDCCKKYDHWILDFDHIHADKIANVSQLIARNCSEKRVREEIAKCEIVCSNCHRDRTYKRRQAKKLLD
jgi:hypothetical protein